MRQEHTERKARPQKDGHRDRDKKRKRERETENETETQREREKQEHTEVERERERETLYSVDEKCLWKSLHYFYVYSKIRWEVCIKHV